MMSTVSARRRGHRGRARGFRVGVAGGLVVPLAVLAAFSFLGDNDSSLAPVQGLSAEETASQRDALAEFEDALAPIREQGASTVVYGMRPGIDDIYGERFDTETLTSMAAGWVSAMRDARERLAAVKVPPYLEETVGLYGQAYDAYLAAAESLHTAARARGEARREHISTAADSGERADRLYDAAEEQLRQHRERLGLSE